MTNSEVGQRVMVSIPDDAFPTHVALLYGTLAGVAGSLAKIHLGGIAIAVPLDTVSLAA